MASVR
jgi:hypothetical protein